MKYELAYSNRHNCTDKRGHLFRIAKNEEAVEIRKEYSNLICAVWICRRCGKVTQSI